MRYLHQFVGSTRLATARAQISAAAAQWSAQWRVDHASDPLTVAVTPAQAGTAAGADSDADWATLVFGSAQEQLPADDTRSALLTRARRALIQLLLADAANAAAHAAEPQTTLPDDGRARITATLAGNGVAVTVLLDASHYDRALPPVLRPELALRDTAIGEAPVSLQLSFALARIGAEELRQLQPGVVIRAAHALDQPFALGTPEQPAALHAYLGQQDGHKAIRISPPPASATRNAP